MKTDETYSVDIDRTFYYVGEMMNTRVGKIVTWGIVAVACIFLSGQFMRLLAGAVLGYKSLSAAVRQKPV